MSVAERYPASDDAEGERFDLQREGQLDARRAVVDELQVLSARIAGFVEGNAGSITRPSYDRLVQARKLVEQCLAAEARR